MLLVVGGTGNIGRALIPLLVQAGQPVRALVRSEEEGAALPPGVEPAVGDLGTPASLDAALRDVDRAFLLSSPSPDSVQLQGNFLRAAHRAGRVHVVKSSVYGATTETPARFIRWHREIEQDLEASGLPWTFVRPNLFFQTLLQSAAPIKQGVYPVPQGDGKVSLVDVRDIAAVAAAALTQEGHADQVYTVTGPEALSAEDLAAQIGAATGRPVQYQDVAPDQYIQGLTQAGLPLWMAEGLAELQAYYTAGHAADVTETVLQVTGRPPHVFADWTQENTAAFR